MKISLYVCVHMKTISWKFCILNSSNIYLTCTYLRKYKVFYCEIFNILFSYDNEDIGRFLNLHYFSFKNFYFCTKLCILTNSRELISNISIAFQTCSPKCQIRHFCSKFFLLFCLFFLCFFCFEQLFEFWQIRRYCFQI